VQLATSIDNLMWSLAKGTAIAVERARLGLIVPLQTKITQIRPCNTPFNGVGLSLDAAVSEILLFDRKRDNCVRRGVHCNRYKVGKYLSLPNIVIRLSYEHLDELL